MDGYTLFMRKSIHDSSGKGYQEHLAGPPNSGTYSKSQTRFHFNGEPFQFSSIQFKNQFSQISSTHTANGNNQTRGPMDRCAHASSFVRITHSLQRVVCTLSLGSKSRTTVLGSARQNKSPQSRWPSIHASLTFHIIFSVSPLAASIHLQQFRNPVITSGDNSPTIYNSS